MAKEQRHLLLTMAYAQSKSFTTAMQGLRYIVEYGFACDANDGQMLNVDDYAAHVGVSLSQAYRRKASFKSCFPQDDPLAMWAWIKPLLMKSSFKNEHPRAQAVYIGTLKTTFTS